MNHEVKIRIVEKRVETAAGSFLYGFLEGLGRTLPWLILVAFVFWHLSDELPDSDPPKAEQQ